MSNKEKSLNRFAHKNKEVLVISAKTLRTEDYHEEEHHPENPVVSTEITSEVQEAFNAAKFSLAVLLCCGILFLLLLSAFVHAILWQLILLCMYCVLASLWIIYKIRYAYHRAQKGNRS